MAALFLTRDASALAGAEAQLRRHGFGEIAAATLPGWHLLHAGYIQGGPATRLVEHGASVSVAGTITVDGRMGTDALRTLLAIDPTNEYATLMLARTLERQSRHDEAAGVRRLLVALTGDERHLDEHRLA